jgi:hypothetical protein
MCFQNWYRQLNAREKRTFVDMPAFLNSSVHRACSHDAPKNFVLPLLEHHRLVGSCLVITRRRTGTTAILVVSGRGVGARLGNIRSRKNTKCFADYSRGIDDSTSARRLQTRSHRQSDLDLKGDRLSTPRPHYIATKSI